MVESTCFGLLTCNMLLQGCIALLSKCDLCATGRKQGNLVSRAQKKTVKNVYLSIYPCSTLALQILTFLFQFTLFGRGNTKQSRLLTRIKACLHGEDTVM